MIKSLTHKEISKRGGLSTMAKHGREYYSAIGKKGGSTNVKRYGVDYFKKLSAAGVAARQKTAS